MTQAGVIVLYEGVQAEPLGKWVFEDAVAHGLEEVAGFTACHALAGDGASSSSEANRIAECAVAVSRTSIEDFANRIRLATDTERDVTTALGVLVVIVFWDGQTEESKQVLSLLKQLTEPNALGKELARVGVTVQALNAKKGAATITENRMALVSSLRKKLQSIPGYVASSSAQTLTVEPAARPAHVDPEHGGPPSAFTARVASLNAHTDASAKSVEESVYKGQGECFYLLCRRDLASIESVVQELYRSCDSLAVGCTPMMAEPRKIPLSSGKEETAAAATSVCYAQEFFLRRCCPPSTHVELRLAMCGNVDSGKSTLTSVLTRGCRDDGRGLARAYVFNHKHEAITGRTSSVSENHLGFSEVGEVVNYSLLGLPSSVRDVAAGVTSVDTSPAALHVSESTSTAAAVPPPGPQRQFTARELASHSAKVVTLYDLAGHEKYLKTTVLGMTRNLPDYACIVISANNGIQRMTKEHLALCLALKLPFFIVVTRIDATPPNVHDETLASIHKLMKIPSVRKHPYPVRTRDEVNLASKRLQQDHIAPIFEVSNVTGAGIASLLEFIHLLPIRKDWLAARKMPCEMVIDSTFFVTGVGTVVGGIVTQGVIHVNDTVLLGPDGFGKYRPVSIKSIHVKGVDSPLVEAGNDAALCLKKEKRSAIRKGNILADAKEPPKAYWQFEANVRILNHSTTITTRYEPVIHSTTVRQSARILRVGQEVLRTGDESSARFHYLYRPEYMKVGQRIIFSEGRTKGIGTVTKVIAEPLEEMEQRSKARKKVYDKTHLGTGK